MGLEFLAATMDKSVFLKQEKLYEAFRLFDKVMMMNFNQLLGRQWKD